MGRFWPSLCENQNSTIQSGKSKPIHGSSIKHLEFMGLIKRYARPFIECHPNINEREIVFTYPRPTAELEKIEGQLLRVVMIQPSTRFIPVLEKRAERANQLVLPPFPASVDHDQLIA